MSRLLSAVKLLAALAAVGGVLFLGMTFLLDPGGHGGGNALADNPASRAIRNVFDPDDEVVNGVQTAHREFNREVWGDGGDLTAACTSVEDALTTAKDGDTYGPEQVNHLAEVARQVCEGSDSPLDLHDALVDVEESLRDPAR